MKPWESDFCDPEAIMDVFLINPSNESFSAALELDKQLTQMQIECQETLNYTAALS